MSGNRVFRREMLERRKKERFEKRCPKPVLREIENKWNRHVEIIPRDDLLRLYIKERKSMQEIADIFHCSLHKVVYWMWKYRIPRRDISDAIYTKRNSAGDPFSFKNPSTVKEGILFGMGLGVYWGVGDKFNQSSIRMRNSDPKPYKNVCKIFEINVRGKERKNSFWFPNVFGCISRRNADILDEIS